MDGFRILVLGDRAENGHETASESVSRAVFFVDLSSISEPEPMVTVPGPTLAETRQNIYENENIDFSFLM